MSLWAAMAGWRVIVRRAWAIVVVVGLVSSLPSMVVGVGKAGASGGPGPGLLVSSPLGVRQVSARNRLYLPFKRPWIKSVTNSLLPLGMR